MAIQILYGTGNMFLRESQKRRKTSFNLFLVPDANKFPNGEKPVV